MTARPGHKAQVKATGTSTAFTDAAAGVVAGTSNETWEISDSTKDIFDPRVTFTVEASENSGSTYATLAATEFSIDYLIGRVNLDGYTSGSGVVANVTDVRISGSYLPKYTILNARSASITLPTGDLDSAVFEHEGNARIYDRSGFDVDCETISRQWTPLDGAGGSEKSLVQMIQDEDAFVFELQATGDSSKVIRGWVLILNDSEEYAGGSINTSSLTLGGSLIRAAMSTQSTRSWDFKV